MITQKTLLQSFVYVGRGSDSNDLVTVNIHPAPTDSGIHFIRLDKDGHDRIVHANWSQAECTANSIDLVNQQNVRVEKVEFILAALKLARVDNAVIELYSEQVGVGCGDVSSLCQKISNVGTKSEVGFSEKKRLERCLAIERDNRYAIISPAGRTLISLDIKNISAENNKWCLATFDSNNVDPESVGPDQHVSLGIETKGDRLPHHIVHSKMLSTLGLITLITDYTDVHLQGIRFNLELGLRLLRWLYHETESESPKLYCVST